MLNIGQQQRVSSNVLQTSYRNEQQRTRKLREAGLLYTTGSGKSCSKLTLKDSALCLLASLVQDHKHKVAEKTQDFAGLVLPDAERTPQIDALFPDHKQKPITALDGMCCLFKAAVDPDVNGLDGRFFGFEIYDNWPKARMYITAANGDDDVEIYFRTPVEASWPEHPWSDDFTPPFDKLAERYRSGVRVVRAVTQQEIRPMAEVVAGLRTVEETQRDFLEQEMLQDRLAKLQSQA
jgi:hypothetical protein